MKANLYNIKKIQLDMDGCIVDDYSMLQAVYPTKVDMKSHLKLLSVLGKRNEFVFPLIHEAIKRNLFLKAKPTLFLTALKDLLIPYWKHLGIEVEILSSTMKDNEQRESLHQQKLAWCAQHLPNIKVNLVAGASLKKEYAEEGTLLIDDSYKNVSEFIANGGFGIHYHSLNETMELLRLLHLTP